jgi:hypothetical protein
MKYLARKVSDLLLGIESFFRGPGVRRPHLYSTIAGTAVLSTVCGITAAQASIIEYSTRVAFGAALGAAEVVETFDGVTAPFVIPNGTSFNGVTYTSSNGNPLITSGFLALSQPNTLGEDVSGFFLASDTMTFSFPSPIRALGISINTFDTGPGFTLTDNLDDVATSSFDPFPGQATGEFVGFTSTIPFTAVTFASVGGFSSTLDNLSYAVAPVVEPGTLVLLSVGLFGLWGIRRRAR